jgi:Fe2+ or Zn2+ uptake regulation protein
VKTQAARLPENYALLRDIVSEAGLGSHQTAHDIFVTARERRPGIGLATVHRGLARLCESGEIMKIDVPSGDAAWYEPPAPPHAHLHCESCGGVVDVDYATAPRTLRRIAERDGIHIRRESLTFRGLCGDCARVR